MKIFYLYEKLKQDSKFQDFIKDKKNEDAYLFLGFFIFDSDFKLEFKQFDFFVPKTREIVNFILSDNGINMNVNEPKKEDENKSFIGISPEDLNINFDGLDDAIRQSVGSVSRAIAILHKNKNKKLVFNVNCIKGLNVTNLTIDAKTKEVIKEDSFNLVKNKSKTIK